MLIVEALTYKPEGFSLENINLKVEAEKIHVIIGPTGSGKTLLLETIIGLRKPHSGKIFLNGKNTEKVPPEKRNIAYVPQDLALFPHLTVEQNIFYSHRFKKHTDKKLSDYLINSFGVSHLLNRKINNLSGGEKQRVALLRTLHGENNLLILDEAFSAINETTKNELRLLLKKIQSELKMTVILVTHDLDEAFFLGDNISIISDGRILETNNKKELYFKPKTIETARFLGISNIFEGTLKKINNKTIINCKQLNTKLKIENSNQIDNNVKFAIRKNHVMILRDDLLNDKQENILSGTVELIIEKVSFYDVIIQPENSNYKITSEIPDYAFNKMKIHLNKKVRFTLKKENIFLVS